MMELKISKHRNVFKPRWWQFRFRYRLWQQERRRKKILNELDPDIRKAYLAAEKEVERRTLFGDPDV
jgi:hypothetical protein